MFHWSCPGQKNCRPMPVRDTWNKAMPATKATYSRYTRSRIEANSSRLYSSRPTSRPKYTLSAEYATWSCSHSARSCHNVTGAVTAPSDWIRR